MAPKQPPAESRRPAQIPAREAAQGARRIDERTIRHGPGRARETVYELPGRRD